MKRTLIALLALIALFRQPALAEIDGSALELAENETLAVDLDGDGHSETVAWTMLPGEYDDYLTVTVEAGGKSLVYPTQILYAGQVWLADLDGDGSTELFMTGDEMSDDYVTYCLRYAGGRLYELLFPNARRGDVLEEGYYKDGYGRITALEDGRVTLTGSQDVLGTWMASRTFALSPVGRFEFADEGLWLRDLPATIDDDVWVYGALTAAAYLPYTGVNGAPDGVLEPGAQILVIATDKQDFAWFTSRHGQVGKLAISPDYSRGWGWLVDGAPEEDCFRYVPYAD